MREDIYLGQGTHPEQRPGEGHTKNTKYKSSILSNIIFIIIGIVIFLLINFFSGSNQYFYMGYYYQFKGDLKSAAESYSKFIKEDDSNADAYYNRGSVYVDLGEFELAIKDFTRSIELKDDDYEALYSRGLSYNYLLRYDDAVKDLLKVIDIKPDFPDAYSSLGGTYLVQKKYDLAILYYDKAYEIDPEFGASTNYFKAYVYEDMGKAAEAVKHYNQFLELADPDKYPEVIPYIQDAKMRINALSEK